MKVRSGQVEMKVSSGRDENQVRSRCRSGQVGWRCRSGKVNYRWFRRVEVALANDLLHCGQVEMEVRSGQAEIKVRCNTDVLKCKETNISAKTFALLRMEFVLAFIMFCSSAQT
jgi:hypothetical protein